MKAIHFNDFESYAGAETAIKLLRSSHEESGITTFLYTKKEIGSHLTPNIIKTHRCKKIFKKIKPDIVHIHNTVGIGLAPVVVARTMNIPLVWTLHDYKAICPNTLLLKGNNTICEDMNCLSCNPEKMVVYFNYPKLHNLLKGIRCVVASDYVKERYKNIINTRRIYWDADKSLLKLKIQSSFNSKEILFGGRRDNEKGVLYAILALKRLVKKYPESKLIFTGESRGYNIKQLSRIYGLERNIIDFGFLPRKEYIKILQRVNCVICPSIWEEPFNLTLLEAMAAGKPVITTAIGGQKEVVGDVGILIEPKSSIDIYNSVDNLFSDKIIHTKMSKKSRERAKEFKNCGQEYKGVYEEAIKFQ